MNLSCEDLREMLPDYLAGVLPPEENRRLQAHLETCTACALEVTTVERTWSDMALLADEQPSERLRASFYARLHEAEREAARPTLARRLAGFGSSLAAVWPRRPAFQMAAAMATLVLGVVIGLRVRGTGAPVVLTVAPPSAVAPAPSAAVVPSPASVQTLQVPPAAAATSAPAAISNEDVHALREEVRSLGHLVALSLLRNESAADRLQGVSYSREAGTGDPRILAALLEAANRDPNDNVRLAAIDALRPLLGRSEVRDSLLAGFEGQRSPLVQIAVVDAVAASSSRDAGPALRSLLARPKLDPAVRQRLEANLGARS